MEKFIPKAKLSKKARRDAEKEQRRTWMINPVSRTKQSKKVYNRKNARQFESNYQRGGIFIAVSKAQ